MRWHAQVPLLVPDEGPAQLTVADGMLYIGTARAHGAPPGGALYALDARDGALRWRAPLDDNPLSVPVISDGAVYVADGAGIDTSLYAFRASDGRLLWRTPTDSLVGKAPVVVDGVVYATSAQQTVYALDARDGTLRWYASRQAGPAGDAEEMVGVVRTLLVAGAVVYVGTERLPPFPLALSSTSGGAVYAPRVGDGARPLSYHSAVTPSSPLLLGGNDGFIYALKVGDGTRLWTYHSQEAPPFAPLLLGP